MTDHNLLTPAPVNWVPSCGLRGLLHARGTCIVTYDHTYTHTLKKKKDQRTTLEAEERALALNGTLCAGREH